MPHRAALLCRLPFRRVLSTCVVVGVGLASLSVRADSSLSFTRDIRPILADKCFTCHGPDEARREANLRLDRQEDALAEADSGLSPIVPGAPDESELVARITSDDLSMRMPPEDAEKQLTTEEIEKLKQWIAAGAPWQKHWAFVPPERGELPPVELSSWPRNPIDRYVLARLEQEGLEPSPEADRETLIRRVSFDLTGLPPTPEEIDAFIYDSSPGAYERLVNRLLESPRYGEHMARYWLDAARYGDTHGLHLDNYREIWPYRDWVVKAFNRNLPFDQFVIEQLAGDLLEDPTIDQIVATGFNRCNVSTSEGGSITEEVHVRNVVDRVVTTGTVFLGLTLDCTRCHDHKYDPLTMNDFYSLFAYFNSIDGEPLDGNKKDHAPIQKVAPPEKLQLLTQYGEQIKELEQRLLGEWPELDQQQQAWEARLQAEASEPTEESKKISDEVKAILAKQEADRSDDEKTKLRNYYRNELADLPEAVQLREQLAGLRQKHEALDQSIPVTLVYRERDEPRTAYSLVRGEYDQKGPEVQRKTPAVLPPVDPDWPNNRLGLAYWLVQPEHPLTARVTVNRFWQQVFGTGLVKTADDFGTRSEPPSHPQLLDWLALELIDTGWDVKGLMKRIVMSATYRQSSRRTAEDQRRDPQNRLLARGPRFRLDAETLRDQALYLSGLLVEKQGGPSVKPPQPDGLWFAVGYSGSNTVRFVPDEEPEKIHRRTLYTFIKRTAPPPQMSIFDGPSREAVCVRRERTNTPLQALLLMNDPQFVEPARALADRMLSAIPEDRRERAARMFRTCTGRQPTGAEVSDLLAGIEADQAYFAAHLDAAHHLIESARLVETDDPTIDSHPPSVRAAWTMAASLMLNLDEVVTKN